LAPPARRLRFCAAEPDFEDSQVRSGQRDELVFESIAILGEREGIAAVKRIALMSGDPKSFDSDRVLHTPMHEAGPIQHSRTTPSPTPTLRELAATLFRQSRYVIGVFVLVVLATLLALMSPRYEAHLKVLLRRGRSDPVVSAQPASLADFSRPSISEEELNSEVELLRDEALLKQVVAQCGLASPGDVVSGRSESVEHAVRKLARALSVEPLRKSNLIQVRYQAAEPQVAANVLSTLSTFYLRKHTELQRPSGEVQFFENQTAEYETRLHKSEAELVRFTRDRGVASPVGT
jgi:uncharacterized protein involved in exopolysaccharide biosynthesis